MPSWHLGSIRSRDDVELVFEFQTANGVAHPIFVKLAELYPEASFAVSAIDEGGPEYEGKFSGCHARHAACLTMATMIRINQSRPVLSLRAAAGISQTELARRLGVHQSRVVKMETTEASGRPIQLDTLQRVAKACGFSLQITAHESNHDADVIVKAAEL